MYLKYFLVILISMCFNFHLRAQKITLKINLRGVAESNITLLPLVGANAFKSIVAKEGVRNGTTTSFSVPHSELPGEFVLHFETKEKELSTPSSSERRLFISGQNLELWVNPPFCNNNDSTWFQKGEKENTAYNQFALECGKEKAQISRLQNFIMNNRNSSSTLYQQGLKEYEKRLSQYNRWILAQATLHSDLFVSHTFRFQYLPMLALERNEAGKVQSVLDHYFDGIDFKDPLLLKTANLKEWMDGYVNIYGNMSKTEALRDSLFTLAGKNSIEQARAGNPKIYGWMVDYFYAGYEAFGIRKGMAMLQKYIDDPKCLTSKKQQIIKRVDSMTRLAVGTLAPDFSINGLDGSIFNFHAYKGKAKYKLLLFWSADCEHCQQFIREIKPWYQDAANHQKLDLIALSVDDTEAEVSQWGKTLKDLPGWIHLRAKGGIRSTIANQYAILSTPVMFLVDSQSNRIRALPDNLQQLTKYLEHQ